MGSRPRSPVPPEASRACLPSGLDLSSSHLRFLTARIRERRRAIGSRWRRLTAGRQALLTLAHLRNGHPYAQLAAGFGIGTTTACRCIAEAVDLLAALAPTLEQAVREASRKAFVLLDGTLLPTDRIATDRPFYSGRHGMNIQILADPAGRLLWACPALAGAAHDIRAAREHGIFDALASASIPCWADKGYQDAGPAVRVPFRGRWENLSAGQQAVNRSQAKTRALVEPAVATQEMAAPAQAPMQHHPHRPGCPPPPPHLLKLRL